jgi:hypothetical protein
MADLVAEQPAEQEPTMLHHADSLKIRIDYFRPRHALVPAADALRRAVALASHRYTLHASLLAITAVGAVAGMLN